MGCVASKPVEDSSKHINKTVSTKIISPRKGPITKLEGGEDGGDIIDSFDFITNEINSIQCPGGMVSIACLNTCSFAIATAKLEIYNNFDTDLDMPIIVGSVARLGRMICLGHVGMLSRSMMEADDTASLFKNIFKWITSKQTLLSAVLLISLDKYEQDLSKELQLYGFRVQRGDFSNNFSYYGIIILSSEVDPTEEEIEKLRKYSDNGGAIICCYVPPANENDEICFNINSFLHEYGVSFMNCSINSEKSKPLTVIIPYSYNDVKDKALPILCKKFKKVISASNVNVDVLDDIATEIRYMIMVSDVEENKYLAEILNNCWQYLSGTSYHDQYNNLVPNLVQNIIIVLITDISAKLPPTMLSIIPDCEKFPGIAHSIDPNDHMAEIPIRDNQLISTGLWLPAGILAKVTVNCETELKNVLLQVGIHTTPLAAEPTPWHRWPNVVYATPLVNGENDIYSQCGGLVYIAVEDCDKMKLPIKFHKFIKAPRAVEGKPESFAASKELGVPWAEIAAKRCVVTLPKTKYDKIKDIDAVYGFFNKCCKFVSNFMHYQIRRPFRVVFDAQLPGAKPLPTYPIFLMMEDLDDLIFKFSEPSYAMFNLLYSLAFVCIRDNQFTKSTEIALSQLVAAHVMNLFFEDFDILKNRDYITSPLCDILWKVHRQIDSNAIPTIFKSVNEEIPEEKLDDESKWVDFVLELCRLTKYNLVPELERIHRFPLNIATELENYPKCDLFD